MLNGAAVVFFSKSQTCVSLSTCESEYIALSNCVQEVVWLRGLLEFLGCKQPGPTVIFEDNQAAMSIANNALDMKRSKAVDVRYHYTREKQSDGIIRVEEVGTAQQMADICTKVLDMVKQNYFWDCSRGAIPRSNNGSSTAAASIPAQLGFIIDGGATENEVAAAAAVTQSSRPQHSSRRRRTVLGGEDDAEELAVTEQHGTYAFVGTTTTAPSVRTQPERELMNLTTFARSEENEVANIDCPEALAMRVEHGHAFSGGRSFNSPAFDHCVETEDFDDFRFFGDESHLPLTNIAYFVRIVRSIDDYEGHEDVTPANHPLCRELISGGVRLLFIFSTRRYMIEYFSHYPHMLVEQLCNL
jgi:hypothetical protein